MTDTPTDVAELVERLRKLVAEATPAPWELDTEYDPDALYSGGGGCGSGFKNYFIGAQVADGTEQGRWATLFDSVNSDHKLVEEEYDEDGKSAWDETARRNAETVVALVNAAPTLFDTIKRLLAENARLTAEREEALAKRDAEIAEAIAVMMSEFVDNWPAHKKVSTSIALIAKTLQAALDTPNYPLDDDAGLNHLGLLFNHVENDSPQFTRWQMVTAINHGMRIAREPIRSGEYRKDDHG